MVSVEHNNRLTNRQLMSSVLASDKNFALEIIGRNSMLEEGSQHHGLIPN
jgi:hypothetical protein